jgi:hypothetical protein
MMLRHLAAASALALAALVPAAQAASLPADGSWTTVLMDDYLPPNTNAWVELNADGAGYTPSSYTVTIAAGFQGTLTVVDTAFAGDRFNVIDNGALLGQTGAAVADTGLVTYIGNPDAALADSSYSRGVFTLGAGSHVITGALFESPYSATTGAIKLDVSPVPEPATLATLLAGLSLLTVAIRRRNGSK